MAAGIRLALALLEPEAGGDPMEKELQVSRGNDNEGSSGLVRSERSLSPVLLPFASPFSLMRRLMEDLDDLIDGGGQSGRRGASPTRDSGGVLAWVPPLEVAERDGKLVVRAEVPGVSKDQLRVEIDDGQLVISGERTQDFEERRGGVYRSERRYGRFTRAVALPEGADLEQAQASFSNGVLEITIPAPPRPRGKTIEIKDDSSDKAAH